MPVVRYPDPAIEIIEPRFESMRLGNAAVEQLWTGARWTEGPVWYGDLRCLLFSDIPNDRLLRWDEATGLVTVFRSPAQHSNGNTRDRQGRLVTCEHQTRRVTRTEHDGHITVLADGYMGRRLNAPNDVVVARDGAVWFTDPGYGILFHYEGGKAEFELPTHVYRVDPVTGALAVMTDDLDRPNGLCFSPDEQLLYVVDSGEPRHIRVFDVVDGAAGRPRLGASHVFADMAPGTSDGIRVDIEGNLWAAAAWGGEGFDGVHCFAPDGTLLGRIHLPESCSNICFGGLHKHRLFMTASQSLYSVFLNVAGL
jgi:gluconolactonase